MFKYKDEIKFSESGLVKYSAGFTDYLNDYRRTWRWLVLGNAEEEGCLRLVRIDLKKGFPRVEIWHTDFLESA